MTIPSQKKTYGPKFYHEGRTRYKITATARHDDDCHNGRNTFSITGEIYQRAKGNNLWMEDSSGCVHEEIAEHFPELAPLIKWHLTSTDGPLHYVENTMYLASERDCYGLLAGDVKSTETRLSFGSNPVTLDHLPEKFVKWLRDCKPGRLRGAYDFEVIGIDEDEHQTYGTRYTFSGYGEKWHECPFKSEQEGLNVLAALKHHEPKFTVVPVTWGEGKQCDLEAARRCAIWPDATPEQLTDKTALEARLPALLAEFRRDVESLGLVYDA